MLHAGYIVLADRYIYTAFARDAVRGCNRDWIRRLYSYARQPDVTFFFDVPLEIALERILAGRPQLKFHEAGMDIGFSNDPYESFRIFQGKINEEYQRMIGEYDFVTVDATRPPDIQQPAIRRILEDRIDLAKFRWRGPAHLQQSSVV